MNTLVYSLVLFMARYRFSGNRFAVAVALIGSIGGLLFGYDLGVIAGALPSLSSRFGLTIKEKELVASIMLVGCIFGSIFGGSICDLIGRKRTIFMVCFLFIVSGLVLWLSSNLLMLSIGRFIVGIGVSISAIVDISYLTEVSRIEHRGALVSVNELMITIGLLLAYVIDYIFMDYDDGWRWMFGFPVLLAALWAGLMVFMPESPRWLIVNGRFDEALQVLEQIYSSAEEAKAEFNNSMELVRSLRSEGDVERNASDATGKIEVSSSNNNSSSENKDRLPNRISSEERLGLNGASPPLLSSSSSSTSSIPPLLTIAYEWRLSIFTSVALMIAQNFSGHAAVLTYAPEFFGAAGYHRRAAGLSTVVLGIVKVVATVISILLVDKMGRKPMLLAGIAGMAISLSAVIIILSSSEIVEKGAGVGLLVAVCIFVASYAIGFGPMTWLITSELYSDEYRGRLIGISTIANWCGSLIVVSSFLSLVASIGVSSTLMYYVVMLVLSFAFVVLLVPETRQKETIEIIEDLNTLYTKRSVSRFCPRTKEYHMISSSHDGLSSPALLSSATLSPHIPSVTTGSTSVTGNPYQHHSTDKTSSAYSPLLIIANSLADSNKIPFEQKNE